MVEEAAIDSPRKGEARVHMAATAIEVARLPIPEEGLRAGDAVCDYRERHDLALPHCKVDLVDNHCLVRAAASGRQMFCSTPLFGALERLVSGRRSSLGYPHEAEV